MALARERRGERDCARAHGCVIFTYAPGGREGCLEALGRFSFAAAESSVTLPGQSLREITAPSPKGSSARC